jgi:hypothetical protein
LGRRLEEHWIPFARSMGWTLAALRSTGVRPAMVMLRDFLGGNDGGFGRSWAAAELW